MLVFAKLLIFKDLKQQRPLRDYVFVTVKFVGAYRIYPIYFTGPKAVLKQPSETADEWGRTLISVRIHPVPGSPRSRHGGIVSMTTRDIISPACHTTWDI